MSGEVTTAGYNINSKSTTLYCSADYNAGLYCSDMNEDAKAVGARILDALNAKAQKDDGRARGNQSDLARFVEVKPQAVQKWIAGKSIPRGKNLRKVAEYLGMTPSEILFGKGKTGARKFSELTDEEVDLVAIFRSLSPAQRGRITEIAERAAEFSDSDTDESQEDVSHAAHKNRQKTG